MNMMDFMTSLLFDWKVHIITLIIGLYIYFTWHFNYFKYKNIPSPKPYPIIGTAYIVLFQKLKLEDLCKKYGKIFGWFQGRKPVIVISKEELLRDIFVKKFNSFTDHAPMKFGDKYIDRVLFFLPGDEWRNIRKALTPTFTSGKLRGMKLEMNSCCREMVNCLNDIIEKENSTNMNAKDFSGNFSMDVIGRTTFGLEVNSQKDTTNEFVKHSKAFPLGGSWRSNLLGPLIFLSPGLLHLLGILGIGLFPVETSNFFVNILIQSLQAEEKDIANRNDFLALMVKENKLKQTQKETGTYSNKGLQKIDILASGFIFFMAGYDSVSSGISVTMYHLGQNPDWQTKVLEEIEDVLEGKEEDITYNTLKEMSLLEMCIEESLRLTSPVSINNRVATEDVDLNGLSIEKGTTIWIPIHAVHHDPEYYSDPDKFDPMRFTAKAKAARSKFVYLPFGVGPRECIGKRLAIMEMKMALVYILRNFTLSISSKNRGVVKKGFEQISEVYVTVAKREKC